MDTSWLKKKISKHSGFVQADQIKLKHTLFQDLMYDSDSIMSLFEELTTDLNVDFEDFLFDGDETVLDLVNYIKRKEK